MGLFRWLFSLRHPPKVDSGSGLWNPEGVDRLFNEELHQAIDTFAADSSPANRRRVYELLLSVTYCIPESRESAEGGPLIVTAIQYVGGERAMVAFTDPCAMRRWKSNPPAMMVLTAAKLFELVLANNFAQLLLNPAGPAGGQLSRREVESLAKGVLPDD